ncbi:hypothetical protein HanPSC8_Chr16g0715471 [Helianthus annuus]|nr:hypothetical protein HanPSC8_Chr16g0715471 [Helianthus annuus]
MITTSIVAAGNYAIQVPVCWWKDSYSTRTYALPRSTDDGIYRTIDIHLNVNFELPIFRFFAGFA